MNTAISDIVIDTMVNADFAGALERRFHRRGAVFQMAHDVLDHDDRVVDHEAHRDRQRHQREIVQAVAQLIEYGERSDQRQRHRYRRNDGRPEFAQEDENHHHDQRIRSAAM